MSVRDKGGRTVAVIVGALKIDMSIIDSTSTAELLLFYPGESLRDQIELWNARDARRRIHATFERSLPEIRKLLRTADAAMIDASGDPSQATDAFLQAVCRLGGDAVAMYSEEMHDGVESFVRMRGSQFILGPLLAWQWEEFFLRFPLNANGRPAAPRFGRPGLPIELLHDRAAMFKQWFARRLQADSYRFNMGFNSHE